MKYAPTLLSLIAIRFAVLLFCVAGLFLFASFAYAQTEEDIQNDIDNLLAQIEAFEDATGPVQQYINLEPGWNIISTPKVLESHSFSAPETSENFDIYLLDPTQPSGWSTMAIMGQSEFEPLFGYFINNKTGDEQTLTFNYDTTLEPNEKLFERTFPATGWYSIGVANDEYAKTQGADVFDTDNPSKILSLLEDSYDLVIDFTDDAYAAAPSSVALGEDWKAVAPVDIDKLNDFRETKGYAVYIKNPGAKYIGFQNDATPQSDGTAGLRLEPVDRLVELGQWFDMELVGSSETIDVNVVEATLEFDPARLQVVEVSTSNSDFSLWTTEPAYSNEFGTIDVGAGSPNPFLGDFAVFDITFEAVGEGTTTVSYTDVTMLAADSFGTNIYEPSDPATIFVGPSTLGDDDELVITSSENDPDATVFKVDSDDDSDTYTTFVWNLSSDDSPHPITLNTIELDVELSSSTYQDIVENAVLQIEGVIYDDLVVTNGDSGLATLWFDINGAVTIGVGETIEAELLLQFDALDPGNEGVTIVAATRAEDYGAEGIDDLNTSQLAGFVTGETHTLRTVVPLITDVNSSVTSNEVGNGGTISFEFTIEADEDVNLAVADKSNVDGDNDDIEFTISGTDTSIAQSSIALISGDAVSTAAGWTIADGDAATFVLDTTFTVVDLGDSGSYRVSLESIAGIEVDETSSALNLSL